MKFKIGDIVIHKTNNIKDDGLYRKIVEINEEGLIRFEYIAEGFECSFFVEPAYYTLVKPALMENI